MDSEENMDNVTIPAEKMKALVHAGVNLLVVTKKLMCWGLRIFSPSGWLEWDFSLVQVLAVGFESGSPGSQHKSWLGQTRWTASCPAKTQVSKGTSRDSAPLSPQSKQADPKDKNGILNLFQYFISVSLL